MFPWEGSDLGACVSERPGCGEFRKPFFCQSSEPSRNVPWMGLRWLFPRTEQIALGSQRCPTHAKRRLERGTHPRKWDV